MALSIHHPVVALVFATSVAVTLAHADESVVLEGDAAWQKLVGNTIVATTKGGSYTEYYAPGGDLRRVDVDGATRGQWTQQGDTICFDYPDDDDQVCMRVKLQGTSGSFIDPGGSADTFEVLTGNAKNL